MSGPPAALALTPNPLTRVAKSIVVMESEDGADLRLSAIIDGHSNDVRCVAPFGETGLISGSRDATVRLWMRNENHDCGWQMKTLFKGHTSYVTTLCYRSPDEAFKNVSKFIRWPFVYALWLEGKF